MLSTISPAPRERLLEKLLALCRVQAIGQLSASDRDLVRDALAVVDELTTAAKTRAATPTASDTETASMASEPAPSLHIFESRLRRPTPIQQFVARRLGGAPPSTTRAYASNAWKPAKAAPVPTPTGTSKIPKPSIVVRPRVKPAPKPLVEEAPPSPPSPARAIRLDLESDFGLDLLEAVTTQDSAELAIATAVQQLEQLLEWRARVDDDGVLTIQVAPVEGRRLSVTSHQAQLALLALEYSIESVLKTSRFFALEKISQGWVNSPWLRARQRNIEAHAAQVLDWTCTIRTAIGGYHGAMQVRTEDRKTLPPPVWRALSHQPKSCVNVDVYKIMADKTILSPPKRSLARAAYGVGAFTAQVIGQWAPSASAILLKTTKAEQDAVKEQYKLLEKLSSAKADLVAMQLQRSKFAEESFGIGFAGRREPATWQEACDNAHAFAMQAVDDGLVACSRRICALKDNAGDDLEMITLRAAEDTFPGEAEGEDPFTLGYYNDTQVEIAHIHARIGQAINRPHEVETACLLVEDLSLIIGDMAVWADPRFDAHTNARPHEQAAYRDLIMWGTKVLAEIL